MTFFGSITSFYSIRNPYLKSEDYMEISVTREWDYDRTGLLNIFLDLIDSGLNPEPLVDYDDTGYPFMTDLTIQFTEMDSESKYADFAQIQFKFFLGVADWEDYPHYFRIPVDVYPKWFHTTPPVGSTVKALIVNYVTKPEDPYPAP